MLSKIAAFEVRYQIRSPLFMMSFLIFFLLTFGAVTVEEIQIGSKGNAHLNSPFAILQTLASMSLMAIFVVTAFVANVVVRDDETGFSPILRATRIDKFSYLAGRFAGAMAVAFLVICAVPLAMLIGSFMPWLDGEKLGPVVMWNYVYALLVFGLPTLLTIGAAFFALATVTRSMMWSYVGAVALLVLYGGSRALLDDPALANIAALTDPFGMSTLGQITKYWTAADRNTLLPGLSGILLYNRLLWIGVAAALLALTYTLFRFGPAGGDKALPGATKDAGAEAPKIKPLASASNSDTARWLQFKALTRFDMRFVFKSPAFIVLLAIGVLNALASLMMSVTEQGADYLPVTRVMVNTLAGSFTFIPMLVAIYYAGELVWLDRERRMHEIVDASAAPNWAFMAPKILAITGVLLACYLTATLTGMLFQLAHGYSDVAPVSYLLWFVLPNLISALLMGVLAIFVQALAPHKFIGWALMLVFMVVDMSLGGMGFEHNLYRYAGTASVPLSDMNGMGNFWIARAWHQAYWLAFATMLLVITHLMWRRGTETRLAPRFALLRQRLNGSAGLLLGGAAAVWLGCGAYVYYNSNVLNRYETVAAGEQSQADYEKLLWAFEKLPQPTVKHVTLRVDFFPQETRADISGSYLLENRSGQPLSRVDVQWNNELQMRSLALPGATLTREYEGLGHRIYTLATPMQPGEQRLLSFSTRMEQRGFVNTRPLTRIVPNGSFLDNFMVAPILGVPGRFLLQGRAKRRKFGLPAEMRPARREDSSAGAYTYLRHDSDWVTADLTLSTDADQTPVAPGTTVSDTTAAGRRTLVTHTEAPIANFFSMQSARFQVKEDTWKAKDGQVVKLQIYHHQQHDSNVPRMIAAMKASLEVFTTEFSPYQFKQLRIQEFPAYERFAQAFAATVPFSEASGFIQTFNDAERDEKIDQVTFVTAHEVAHQWWAHQMVGADKQGMTMLSETFAQYSALLVMERLYGKEQIRKFLKVELDRYLRGRSGEVVEELPLARVENQPYVHYRKGAVVMYSLKEAVGEALVNRALRKLLGEFAFKARPYASSTDFLRILRAEAGPQHDQLINDLFETITLFDLKATDAKATKRADGKFDVRFKVEAKKLVADGKGKETESALNQPFDIGAFTVEPGKKGFKREAVLLMERRLLKSGTQVISFVLDQAPKFVGVDPYNIQIDRNSDDNLAKVEVN